MKKPRVHYSIGSGPVCAMQRGQLLVTIIEADVTCIKCLRLLAHPLTNKRLVKSLGPVRYLAEAQEKPNAPREIVRNWPSLEYMDELYKGELDWETECKERLREEA